MTGIGFGELFPQTPLGRLASGLAFAWGAVVAALAVAAVVRSAVLSDSEARVDHMIQQT